VVISVRLPTAERSSVEDLGGLRVAGQTGNLVPLSELVRVEKALADKSIYHKNLMPVVYVTGDVAGEEESPVYAILEMNENWISSVSPRGTQWSGTPLASRLRPTGTR